MSRRAQNQLQVVAMAPKEENLTPRNPLYFPIEWERPKPGKRPDIFPEFSPMKTPLPPGPPPMPYDPPVEDEEEEKKEEEEENPDKEEEEQREKELDLSDTEPWWGFPNGPKIFPINYSHRFVY